MRRAAAIRFLVVCLLGSAVIFFLWRVFELDVAVVRAMLPPPEVN